MASFVQTLQVPSSTEYLRDYTHASLAFRTNS